MCRTKVSCVVSGLERVAEELMGRRKWKKYQELVYNVPLKAGEETQTLESATEIKDWEPEDRCCFCDGGVFLDSTVRLLFLVGPISLILCPVMSVIGLPCELSLASEHNLCPQI